MTGPADPPYLTSRISAEDAASGFKCGKHPLDDYFVRHAVANDQKGISRGYVLGRSEADPAELPKVLGYYTLSMALITSAEAGSVIKDKLPKYPLPVALMGRLAVDERAQGRRLGEKLLIDAIRRVVDAARTIGCVGIVVDAKDEGAEAFYVKYGFVTVQGEGWPRRMFLPLATAQAALAGG
jgi:GNAT superfamily N-acetyltransferase